MTVRRVLHVLPHAGAGAQTYLDVLSGLEGYEPEIFELTDSRSPSTAAATIIRRQRMLARRIGDADLVHAHGEVASVIALPWLASRPSVVTLHGLHLLRRLDAGIPKRLGREAVRAIVAAATITICVSEAEREDLAWLTPRLRAKLAVVHNGLPLPPPTNADARAAARAGLGLEPDAVAVLYAGQLELRKDPHTLVRAVRRARDLDERIVLLVAGSGPCASELRSSTTGEDGAVRMLGQCPSVARLLAAADVFVMPSLREGLSYAVLEAMAHGVATIVSDCPGNPEAVGDAGLVFPAGDHERLAAQLLQLAWEPERRSALAAAGRDRIAGELGADQMRARTHRAYESALTEPARAGVAAIA